jgi:hypothetical protein
MTKLFNVLGFDDGVHTCDCCGKTDLKGTFGIEMLATGEILHYGSVCVTRNTGYAKKEINSMARAYEQERVNAARGALLASPEYAALRAKREEARAKGITGLAFKEYCIVESDAEDAVRAALAEKHSLRLYQF